MDNSRDTHIHARVPAVPKRFDRTLLLLPNPNKHNKDRILQKRLDTFKGVQNPRVQTIQARRALTDERVPVSRDPSTLHIFGDRRKCSPSPRSLVVADSAALPLLDSERRLASHG
jgi:hypothetical protein